MKILILGGTAWLGHSIAAAALAAGHSVVCLARGNAIPEGADLVNADRARGDALVGVAARTWDAVVDVAGDPSFVERAVRDLAPAAKRFVFVSSLNVYADPSKKGIVEDEPTLPPLPAGEEASQENYGRAKSACEAAVLAGFGRERSTIVRPGLITGPGDPTNRAAYWPLRFAKPSNPRGRVLVPDAFGQAFSVIDARDLAAWIVRLIEAEIGGVFNAVGNVSTLGEHLEQIRSAAGHTGEVVRAPADWLLARGVGFWAGPRSLPLWVPDPSLEGMLAASNGRALGAGLKLRPARETYADLLAWALENSVDCAGHSGLSDAEERELLDALDRG